MSLNTLILLFLLATIIHNVEEAIWLPKWSKNNTRWHPAVSPQEFHFAIFILTFLAIAISSFAIYQKSNQWIYYLVAGYSLAMLLNVIFPHLLASIITRHYAPGLTSALLLNLPINSLLLNHLLSHAYINTKLFLIAGPLFVIGLLLTIPTLFYLGRQFMGKS
ncbi:HXXEE domain-containing protein [Aliikangiella maris]|uniref:HXXEE domain-containing protein n=2 Tax=Aliikangiella maris TaxID=3162458 RepID=A0ABV2BQX7_9GAMM